MCNSVSLGSAYLVFVLVQKMSINTCTMNKHVYGLWTHQSSMLTPVLFMGKTQDIIYKYY